MSETLRGALLFLINTVFDLYLFIVTIRILLVWINTRYVPPVVRQFILKPTDFIVKPFSRVLPTVKRVELASLFLLFVVELIKFTLIACISFGVPHVLGLLVLACGDCLKMFLETFFYAILIQAIISWVQPSSPIYFMLRVLTAPVMQPLERIIPSIGSIDITPIFALILLQLLIILVVQPVMQVGFVMALGG